MQMIYFQYSLNKFNALEQLSLYKNVKKKLDVKITITHEKEKMGLQRNVK